MTANSGWLAVVGGIAAVVAAGYYLRLLASIWFAPASANVAAAERHDLRHSLAAAALTFPVLVLLLGAIEQWADSASAR